jgi:dTDP-4-amino-4,6-dideoxygalactose transaminase
MKDNLFADHIPLLKPWLDKKECSAVQEVILSGWVSLGSKVAEFENRVAEYVGGEHAVATNSATTSLHLALVVSGIKPGDEVIVPAHTCMATAHAICHSGGMPVFCDIHPDTFNMDPDHVEHLVKPSKTRALMIVHQIGLPADLDRLMTIARKYDLAVIEDAATALGAKYKGRHLGGWNNPTCFSFHPRKMITTGEGGMMIINDEEKAQRARTLRSAGASISDLARHQAMGTLQQQYFEIGYNYRLTDIQAAIGLVQMDKISAMLQQRAEQAAFYNAALSELQEIQTPFVPDYAQPAWTSYCVKIRPSAKVDRDTLLERLATHNISTRKGIQPLYREPVFAPTHPDYNFSATENAAKTTLFLPIFPGLTIPEQEYITEKIKYALIQ